MRPRRRGRRIATRIYLEAGAKKTFACALEWPGWCRSGRSDDDAIERLAAYAERYAPVAARAGLRFAKSAAASFDVVERVRGGANIDFGALGDPPAWDSARPITAREASRLAAIVDASYAYFDEVVAAAPAELRKGPRGGGRDRDKIRDHVLEAELSYARKLNVRLRAADALDARRVAVVNALRAARDAEPPYDGAKVWPYRYAARRFAWHRLDHAWEIEDRSE